MLRLMPDCPRFRALIGGLACGSFATGMLVAAPPPDFARDIRPILAEYCFACHGPDAEGRQAGLRLDDAAAASTPLPSGATVVVPGRSAASGLVRRIESDDEAEVMPPPETGKRVPPAARDLLRAWIDAGAPFETHWAYRNPIRPPVPAVGDAFWVRSPIDAFVLERLEKADIRPAPEAPRHTLLRRLSLDLTGLPPTGEELNSFLADDSTQAYERAVDRLLTSPHCAEKLAMEWLDLARFGDSSGYQDDSDRPNHPYRDAIIEAFHENMPFDQFTIESLAGDLMPNATVMQKIRSGFNRLHRHNEEGGSDPEEFRVVYAIDRTNTTAATWMGVTFGCAQCHDHKYDPFSQKEYYQFLAFFNSLRGEVPVSKEPSPPFVTVYSDQDRRQLDEIDREIAAIEAARARETATAVAGFERWLADPAATPKLAPDAAGGAVARGPHRSYLADISLPVGLSFDTPLRGRGSLVVVKAENSDTEIGHFARAVSETALPGVGIAIAEGPRVIPHFAAADGSVLHGPAIAAQYGEAYDWSYAYDPATGKVTVELRSGKSRSGKDQVVSRSELVVPAERRQPAVGIDSFGISARGLQGHAGPMVLVIDDLEYTACLNRLKLEEGFDPEIEARINAFEMAFRMQASVPELVDVRDEPRHVLEMYGINAEKPSFARNCLLARRLVERGVRFVQLYDKDWDHHGDLPQKLRNKTKETDQGLAALIRDLDQRGLLDETLVVCGGEFGRTAYTQGKLTANTYGRDHHPRCFTMWLAGGGIRRGAVVGKTDDYSYNIVEDPIHVHDLQATILHCLGVDHRRLTYRFQGRDFRLTDVHGEVVSQILV